MHTRTVFLFPGLGAYSSGVLRQARRDHPLVAETFAEIDAEGARPHLLAGHSFGEMAALVSAGAFDLADGVRLVCARTRALHSWEGWGAIAAVGVNETVAEHLIGLVEEPDLVVGCANAPQQTVISGPADAVERAGKAAGALGFFFARLNLPYASHHPSMRPAVAEFMALMAEVRQRSLRYPVYSPVHLRRYHDGDDLRQALADCLVLPVRFVDTVRALHTQGYTRFVEVGALNALTRCVQATVPGVRTFAPLLTPDRESEHLRAAAEATKDEAATDLPAPRTPHVPEAAVVAPLSTTEQSAPSTPANGTEREEVLARLRELYSAALEYPADMLTENAALEAELGVDSLKQTALLSRVVEQFGLRGDPGQLRVWELGSLGRIADHVLATRRGVPA